MPCNCDYGDESLQKKCNTLGQMLCWLCGTLEENNQISMISNNPTLVEWWREHQEMDEKRVLSQMEEVKKRNARKRVNKIVLDANKIAEEFIENAEKVHAVSEYHKKWFMKLAKEVFEEE